MNPDLYESLARLLEYPTAGFTGQLDACGALLRDENFSAFAAGTEKLSLPALEELYIQTFDFNPNCTLDLGWHLFSEDYNRGLFLTKLRGESRRLDVPETRELPDHLPHVLRLLARMTPAEAGDFAATCGVPGVEKTLAALDESNPYRPLLACVLAQLRELAATQTEMALT
jgi:nitrate reductase molybdenum cofactor assembly chaperone